MKNRIKGHLFLWLLPLLFPFISYAQIYSTGSGHIWFFSETPLENIEAHNYQAACALNMNSGELVCKVTMDRFEFEKDLILWMTAFLYASVGFSQDLMEIIEETDSVPAKQFVYSTFASSRLASGHTVESPGKQELVLIISHRFWRLDDGIYDMFGLDNATIRIGFDYGITDRFSAGLGRNTYNKTYDGYLKYRIIQQATGIKGMPFSLTYLTSASVNSLRWDEERKENLDFAHRVSYIHQALMATKLNRIFSLQFMPGFVHKNLVEKKSDPNDMFLLGLGGKIRLTKILSLNVEYYYFVNRPDNERFMHPLAIGFDIVTGGHVFQLLFSNSQPWFESGFLTETNGQWRNGDIYFGFHIQRTFSLGSKPDWQKL